MRLFEPSLGIQMVTERLVNTAHVREVSFIVRGSRELFLRDCAQHLHGIVIDIVPELAIEPAEQLNRIWMPDPPQIVRQLDKRLKRLGNVREDLKRTNRGTCRFWHGFLGNLSSSTNFAQMLQAFKPLRHDNGAKAARELSDSRALYAGSRNPIFVNGGDHA
jgi:hypothetical protein